MELTDQTALVTGGTAGIGLACARLMAREGASVVITGRDAQRGKEAAAGIDGDVRFIQADLSDIESVKSLVRQAGNVDILVNNAASFPAALTVDQEVDVVREDVRHQRPRRLLPCRGPGTRHARAWARQHHQRHHHGRLKGRSRCRRLQRLQGRRRIPHPHLGRRVRAHGVRVNSVAPGPTKTEGVEAEWGETNEELGRALPLGRTAEPEEIAHAVLFLASPHASFITGSTLHADGGGTAI